jgi:hypothetical protein
MYDLAMINPIYL